MSKADREHVPHGLRLLIEAAGQEAAMKLALARGGSRFYIPEKADGSELASIVGTDAAREIVAQLANERIKVPLAKRQLNGWLRTRGVSAEKRCVLLKCARSTIQNWDSRKVPSFPSLGAAGQ